MIYRIVLLLLALLPLGVLSAFSWLQLGADIDGEAISDQSGYSVSLSSDGTVVAIGARSNDASGLDAGHVRVYKWNSTWVKLGADIDGEVAGDFFGFSVSLSSDGTVVAIGANNNDGTASNAGHVRVYKWNSSNWIQRGADIDGEAAGDQSGYSVSISSDGTVVAIGAPFNDGGPSNGGHVRVYKWNSTNWLQRGADINGEGTNDLSGYSVSLSSDGTVVAIGARSNDGSFLDAGHVRVYKWNSPNWVKLGADIDGEAAGDFFGFSVSLSSDGTVVAIGANNNDGTASNAGHVRVYKWNTPNWVKLGADIDGEAASDLSGGSVSISSDGTVLAIGANNNDGTASNAGHVRVHKWNSTNWVQLGADINGEAGGNNFGNSVSMSSDGTVVAIGAPGNARFTGHARVYKSILLSESPSQSPSEAPSEIPSDAPSASPSEAPSVSPSEAPSVSPSASPSEPPSASPSEPPSEAPSVSPSASPSEPPSASPSEPPSEAPFVSPSEFPSRSPSEAPSKTPFEEKQHPSRHQRRHSARRKRRNPRKRYGHS